MPIETIRDLNADTIEELQQLYASNKASESFYLEAAEKVDDGATTGLFGEIANERMLQAAELRDHLYATDEDARHDQRREAARVADRDRARRRPAARSVSQLDQGHPGPAAERRLAAPLPPGQGAPRPDPRASRLG